MRRGLFQQRLQREFEARRRLNPRYSLRAFARFLGTDHATLRQILQGTRGVPQRSVLAWAKGLGMSTEEAAVYREASGLPEAAALARQERVLHRTAEAASIIDEPVHWQIVQLCRSAEFRPDTRWIADRAGVSIDRVNMALTRLLRLGLLRIQDVRQWLPVEAATEQQFRATALARVTLHG